MTRTVRAIDIVIVIVTRERDLSRSQPSLASLKHTTCMACILRLSGSWAWECGWSDTHDTLRLLPMMEVSTTEKAGAVWWHPVQEQRSRAYGIDVAG